MKDYEMQKALDGFASIMFFLGSGALIGYIIAGRRGGSRLIGALAGALSGPIFAAVVVALLPADGRPRKRNGRSLGRAINADDAFPGELKQ